MIGREPGTRPGAAAGPPGVGADPATRLAVVRSGPESEAVFRAMFELTSLGAALADPVTSRFRLVNDALCRMTGYGRDDLLAMRALDLTHPDDRQMAAARYATFLAGVVCGDTAEQRYVRSDGTTIWIQVDAALVRDAAGRPLHRLEIVQDITERKRAERALQESEERYRTVVETQTELICRYLPDTTLTWMNEAYCRYFGRTREQLLGTNFLALVPERERAVVRRHLALVIETGSTEPSEHEVVRADGSVGWQQWTDHVIRSEDGRIVELQGIGRDITERKRTEQALREREEALRRSHRQVRALAGRLLTAGEEERRRLARELHDDVNQRLAALAIGLGTARRRLEAPAALVTQLGDLEDRAVALANDVRRLSHDLHPALLEHAGLAAALRAQCGEVSRVAGVPVVLGIDAGVRLGPDASLCLYRVAQEALRNVVKHARAGRVEVSLVVADSDVVLVVSDDGRGFDAGPLDLPGLGLVSMEERVRLLRGTLTVSSAPGQGTHVRARIPLDPTD